MNIYDYLNKRDILKKMSDNEFEIFLPGFCNALKDYGFQQLLTDYNNKLTDINKNWNLYFNVSSSYEFRVFIIALTALAIAILSFVS